MSFFIFLVAEFSILPNRRFDNEGLLWVDDAAAGAVRSSRGYSSSDQRHSGAVGVEKRMMMSRTAWWFAVAVGEANGVLQCCSPSPKDILKVCCNELGEMSTRSIVWVDRLTVAVSSCPVVQQEAKPGRRGLGGLFCENELRSTSASISSSVSLLLLSRRLRTSTHHARRLRNGDRWIGDRMLMKNWVVGDIGAEKDDRVE